MLRAALPLVVERERQISSADGAPPSRVASESAPEPASVALTRDDESVENCGQRAEGY